MSDAVDNPPAGGHDGGTGKPSTGGEPKKENALLSLLLNIVLPGIILMQLSKPGRLGPILALVIAIALPIGYGIYDGISRRKLNFFSVIGFVSTLLTGVLAFPKEPVWFALKEAIIPIVFAVAILVSHRTEKPLIRLFLWNPDLLDTAKVESKLRRDGHMPAFDRLLFTSSLLLAAALLVSAVANFFISMHLLEGTEGGTAERMEKVGKQWWVTWLMIGLPMMGIMLFALWRLFKNIEKLTGMTMEDMLYGEAQTVKVTKETKTEELEEGEARPEE